MTLYINPYVCGAIVTLTVELILIVTAIIISNKKNKKKPPKE